MIQQQKKFTKEVKKQVTEFYEQSKSRSNLIGQYDLRAFSFDDWMRKGGYLNSLSNERENCQHELIKLREENHRLLIENNILNKAVMLMGRR